MNKTKRVEIYNKFGGRCAYCGQEIEYKAMQVDHYWPKSLRYRGDLENDRIENLMPSCRKCNIHKHSLPPETWRRELSLQITRLRKNTQFDRALRFDQVQITETPIVFYFEKEIT